MVGIEVFHHERVEISTAAAGSVGQIRPPPSRWQCSGAGWWQRGTRPAAPSSVPKTPHGQRHRAQKANGITDRKMTTRSPPTCPLERRIRDTSPEPNERWRSRIKPVEASSPQTNPHRAVKPHLQIFQRDTTRFSRSPAARSRSFRRFATARSRQVPPPWARQHHHVRARGQRLIAVHARQIERAALAIRNGR